MSMTVTLLIGAGPLAARMAADRGRAARGGEPDWLAPWAEDQARNDPNFADSAGASRSSHSQIVSADQPAAESAATDSASRVRLRAIFAVQ